MTKQRRSEAIWVDSRQRWQVNVQMDGKRKTFTSTIPGRKGKHEAEAKADDWLDAGQPDDIRFDAAWKSFLEYMQKNVGASYYLMLRSIGDNWFLDSDTEKRLSTKKLSRLVHMDFQSIITTAFESGKSRRTCKNIRDSAARFFSYASDMGWNSIDLSKIKIPAQAKVSQKKVLQPDKLKLLFTNDTIKKGGVYQQFFYIYACRFLVAMGYRRGELCGFRKEDFNGTSLTVNRSINRLLEETQGKNDNARRTNVLPQFAISILKDQDAMLKKLGIISPWLFPDEHGNRLDPNRLAFQWKTYSEQNGIDVSLHELRHTFISITKAEMPMELLKGIVGHSAAMDTTGVYGHEIDGEKQRAANLLDSIFSRVLE